MALKNYQISLGMYYISFECFQKLAMDILNCQWHEKFFLIKKVFAGTEGKLIIFQERKKSWFEALSHMLSDKNICVQNASDQTMIS